VTRKASVLSAPLYDWPPGQSKDLSFSFKTASAGDFAPPLNHSRILIGVTSSYFEQRQGGVIF
jgi:hypothetical protein